VRPERSAGRSSTRTSTTTPRPSTARSSPRTRSAPSSGPSGTAGCSTEIFPGRTEVPKTLIFAKDDSHADDIVQIVREEFGKGNEFAVKITYRPTGQARGPAGLVPQQLQPRIVVTVDMIATGTDVKPIECVLFMRIGEVPELLRADEGPGRAGHQPRHDLQAVTPDADAKTTS
jgi:type I restriction enzyme, R subunit